MVRHHDCLWPWFVELGDERRTFVNLISAALLPWCRKGIPVANSDRLRFKTSYGGLGLRNRASGFDIGAAYCVND